MDVRHFIEDKHYLGNALADSVYPQILEDLEELFEGDYQEVALGGAIGWGKTMMAEIGIAYDLYLVSCLRDPANTFGHVKGTTLTFLNVAVTKEQAQRVMFSGLFNLIKQSPYFASDFPFQPNIQTEIRFPKNVVCYPVSPSEQAVLGTAVFSAAIDESNFMQITDNSRRAVPGESRTFDQAAAVYEKLSRRIRSRMNQRGRLPGHIWLMSSARYPHDFIERKHAEAKTDPRIFACRYAIWDTRPRHFYMPQSFKVEVGDLTKRSRVLKGGETDVNAERIIDVPMDFKAEFEKNPDGAVRDFAGIGVLSIRPFIARRETITAMFQTGEQLGLKHPFSKLDVTLQDPETEYLFPDNLHWVERNRKFYQALRYAHVDLAKNHDACGVAIGHIVGTKRVRRLEFQSMNTVEEVKPLIRLELVLRVVAPPHGEIMPQRVRALFAQLRSLGMEFGLITYDAFGSMESISVLKEQGFRAEQFSVDTDVTPYEALRVALYDERIICYPVPKLEEELVQLEKVEEKNRVDHPAHGSKDLADSVAAVVQHCEDGWRSGRGRVGLFKFGFDEPSDRLRASAYEDELGPCGEWLKGL